MAKLKTKPTAASAREFVASLEGPGRRRDCAELLDIMEEIAGEPPTMWGTSIVGFGSYRYRYASGRAGTWFRVGFASRKNALTLYLMLDLDQQGERLAALGKHKRGKGCLYIKRLADIDDEALRNLIRASCGREDGSSRGCSH
jgi:hypothetical protein